MGNVMSVANAKKNLSELMTQVADNNERFLIERRWGKTMAALVSAEDLARLEQEPTSIQGLLTATGAWADFNEPDQVIANIQLQRE